MRHWVRQSLPLFLVLSMGILTGQAYATVVVDADINGHDTPLNPSDAAGRLYRVDIVPLPASHITAGLAPGQLVRIRADFPGWNFVNSANDANGNFNVVHYDVDIDKSRPNPFLVNYVPGAGGAPAGTLQWIQFIDTNRPRLPGLPRPYVDPQPNDDTLPFYWTEAERIAATGLAGGTALQFRDRPARSLILSPVEWQADLYLVSWNGVMAPGGAVAPSVTVYDGLRWGFTITCLGRGRPGANVRGGVGGDKFEDNGVQGDEAVCAEAVAQPRTLVLLGLGMLGLLACGWRYRQNTW